MERPTNATCLAGSYTNDHGASGLEGPQQFEETRSLEEAPPSRGLVYLARAFEHGGASNCKGPTLCLKLYNF